MARPLVIDDPWERIEPIIPMNDPDPAAGGHVSTTARADSVRRRRRR